MNVDATLNELRVLVTRPADQAESLCRLLESHGAQVVRLPMQAIEPVRQATAAARALQQARDADAWIFTSANAVRFARTLDAGVWPACIAVGPATAAALMQAGIDNVVTPATSHDSEGVLELQQLRDMRDRRVVVVSGEGGRDAIERGLEARGVRVERIEVYRRVALPHDEAAIATAVTSVDAIIVTNGEALQQLVERIADPERGALRRLQLVVPSRRVVEKALELGFTTPPLVPEQIADAGYLHCLEHWWRAGRRDARMTEDKIESPAAPAAASPESAPPPEVDAPAAVRSRSWLWTMLFVLLVAGIGVGGWQAYRYGTLWLHEQNARIDNLAQTVDALGGQIDRLQTRVSDQSVAVQRIAAEVARLPERLQAQDQAIGELRDELGGGRVRVQLALIEQLLLLANDRVLVARDAPAAIVALDAADARLATLKDPRLFEVRQALAEERAALQAVDQPDLTGAALVLSGLVSRVPQLALSNQAPVRFEPDAQPPPAPPAADAGFWSRAWMGVKRALSSVFSVRRSDGPSPKLLGDEQIALIRQILALRLEAARAALMQRDTAAFRELCASAAAWLDDYFHSGDPAVVAVRAELVRLQGRRLAPPLPDISRSLVLLRAQLEESSAQ